MLRCFTCQKPARFRFQWPWSNSELGVCAQHTTEVTKKARAAAARPPTLEPLTEEATTSPTSSPAPLEPPPAPATSSASVGDDTKPGIKRGHELPPPPDGAAALVAITRVGGVLGFTLKRPGQHDTSGPMGELVVTLQAFGFLDAGDAAPDTKPPPRRAGEPLSLHSHPGQVTPPTAAAALAGAGSTAPPRQRPPVNPPMPRGLMPRPVAPDAHRPPPLGPLSGAFTPPGGAAPTPPPVAPPWAAPVAPDVPPGGGATPDEPTDGSTDETSETVVE